MALSIALCCDLRFAADAAVLTSAFSRRGLVAEWGASWLLPRLVGPGHALDILFSGRKVTAAEAERLGLVNRVLPQAELASFVQDYAAEMARECSPASLRIIKRQVYQQLSTSLGPAEHEAEQLMVRSFRGADFQEGVRAFLEKRPPKFGRVGK